LLNMFGTATEAIAAADIAELTNWRRESFLDLGMSDSTGYEKGVLWIPGRNYSALSVIVYLGLLVCAIIDAAWMAYEKTAQPGMVRNAR
jgi:hypothetical protein